MLDKNDEVKIEKIVEKTTVKVVVDALEKIILPKFEEQGKRLVRIEEKLDATMEMTAKNSEDITMISIDVKEMQEDISDTNFITQRIESKLNTVVKDQDVQDTKTRQLNRRVLKLEAKR